MKNTFLLFVLCLLFSASHASANTHEIKRVITKQFNVSAGSELDINNKYGNIVINAWNKEVIDFSIEIIGKGDKEKIAQQMADRVSIDFNQTGRRVSAQTNFEQQRNFNCNNCGTTVNYTVNVPASVYLNLINKYGNIRLDETTQTFKADVKYGNIYASRLSGKDNTIILKYGNLELGETVKVTLDIKYGNVRIEKIDDCNLNCAYSILSWRVFGTLRADSKYDNYKIGNIGTLFINTAYSNITINQLSDRLEALSLRYCKVKIDGLSENFKAITIDATYTPVRINLTNNIIFKADLSSHYGNIRTNGLKFSDVTLDDSSDRYTKQIKGIASFGNTGTPTATIKIATTYSDIVLSK